MTGVLFALAGAKYMYTTSIVSVALLSYLLGKGVPRCCVVYAFRIPLLLYYFITFLISFRSLLVLFISIAHTARHG